MVEQLDVTDRKQGGGRIIQISSVGGQIALPISSPYHAAKWGLEGFTEAARQEVAEFGVYLTIVEPGGMRTNFQAGLQWTTETPVYREATVGRVRRWIESADDSVYTGNPAKLARASFDTTTSTPPPLRLTLGADAYDFVHQALQDRLAALEAQEALARSMAFAEPTMEEGASTDWHEALQKGVPVGRPR